MFRFDLYESGALYGLRYTFPERGDGIGMHDHAREQQHNVIVLQGSVAAYGPGKRWYVELPAGSIHDFTPEQYPHEIAALEADTVVLGLFMHGKPAGECLGPDERSGEVHSKPLTIALDVLP